MSEEDVSKNIQTAKKTVAQFLGNTGAQVGTFKLAPCIQASSNQILKNEILDRGNSHNLDNTPPGKQKYVVAEEKPGLISVGSGKALTYISAAEGKLEMQHIAQKGVSTNDIHVDADIFKTQLDFVMSKLDPKIDGTATLNETGPSGISVNLGDNPSTKLVERVAGLFANQIHEMNQIKNSTQIE